jgi:hypothetical protein
MDRKWSLPVILLVIILVITCCICVCLILGYTFFTITSSQEFSDPSPWQALGSPTPVVLRPTPLPSPAATSDPGNSVIAIPEPVTAFQTYQELEDTIVPINDLYDLARRLDGKENIPVALEEPAPLYRPGDQKEFWISNNDTNAYLPVDANLQYITDHAYFWIEDGVRYSESELASLAEAFENQIYPNNREFFGSEWTPGVDGDPHIYILYARNVGSGIAGYFSSNDSYNPRIQEYSNGHEMFVFSADNTALDEEFTYGVLAHEFQHMIHWYRDRNESTWLNEGFSDLAMFLNGYDIGGHDFLYILDPDLQLNDWPNESSETSPHYGASFLFTNYFLGRFGEDATKALVAHPDNGMSSIDALLDEVQITDPLDGEPIGADDVFADWVVASFLQDASLEDGRYTYSLYPDAPQPSETEFIRPCNDATLTRDVYQYGVDYIRLGCNQDTTLRFEGSTLVPILPADPYSGEYAFWSNRGDESDMTLTHSFDFTGHTGPLTLSYWTWYDIEKDFDYVYLLASEDGENWEMLFPPSGTGSDPTGANYGWGYNGLSGGEPVWIEESVDISQYAGRQVQLRFEYITDAAVNGEGFMLDDISIPEIGYFSDFEQDDGGWEAAGFVRIQNMIPQIFRLSLITLGDEPQVLPISLSADNTANIPVGSDEAVLVVSGTTRFTRQPATYRFSFVP